MPVNPDGVVPWGRSFDEYVRMFALTGEDLGRSLLDVAAGPSSFAAEVRRRGGRVVAADPLYALTADDIRSRVEAVRADIMDQVCRQMGQFVWEYFASPDDLERERMTACRAFLEDYAADAAGACYRAASLPALPFGDDEFDLALCSHYLFLYSDRLDAPFHVASVRELLRVAREVRVFPVTDLSGLPSPHLPAVRASFSTELRRVEYEFLRGANEMLVVVRR
jgi:hypothetical protein